MSGDGGSPGQQQNGGHWPGYGPGHGQPGWGGNGGWGQGPWGANPVAPKPGVVPLRPLGFGELISGVVDTLRRYFKAIYLSLAAVTGLAAVPVLITGVLVSGALADGINGLPPGGRSDATDEQVWAVAWPLALLGVVFLLAMVVQYVIAAPLSTVVLRNAVLGRPMTAGQAWKETRPRLRATAASIALVYVPMVLVTVLAFVVGVFVEPLLPILLLVLLGVGAYVGIRLAPQIPVVVLEESTPKEAVRRAWQLNRGNWWRSLFLTALTSIAGRIAVNLLSYPFLMVLVTAAGLNSTLQDGDTDGLVFSHGAMVFLMVCGVLVAMLGTLVTAPLIPLANGVLYVDRRIRNERLDVALAEAAGLRFAEPAGHVPPAPAGGSPAGS